MAEGPEWLRLDDENLVAFTEPSFRSRAPAKLAQIERGNQTGLIVDVYSASKVRSSM